MATELANGYTLNDINFVSQRDMKFQSLIEEGLAPDSAELGFCWLASLDMAISRYLPDSDVRWSALDNLVKQLQGENMLTDRGFFLHSHAAEYVNLIAQMCDRLALPVTVRVPDEISLTDVVYEIADGATVIFIEQLGNTGHTMVMDKIVADDSGNEGAIAYWDPNGDCIENARKFITPNQIRYRQENSPIKINGDLIIFTPSIAERVDEQYIQLQLPLERSEYLQSSMEFPVQVIE